MLNRFLLSGFRMRIWVFKCLSQGLNCLLNHDAACLIITQSLLQDLEGWPSLPAVFLLRTEAVSLRIAISLPRIFWAACRNNESAPDGTKGPQQCGERKISELRTVIVFSEAWHKSIQLRNHLRFRIGHHQRCCSLWSWNFGPILGMMSTPSNTQSLQDLPSWHSTSFPPWTLKPSGEHQPSNAHSSPHVGGVPAWLGRQKNGEERHYILLFSSNPIRESIMITLSRWPLPKESNIGKERWPNCHCDAQQSAGNHCSKAHCHYMHLDHGFASEPSLSPVAIATRKHLDRMSQQTRENTNNTSLLQLVVYETLTEYSIFKYDFG